MGSAVGQVVRLNATGTASRHVSDFPKFAQAIDAEPERKWQTEVQKHVLNYAKLPRGWDTYDAPPIGWDAGLFALSILNDFMRPRTPIPQVVPSTAGGVQLEWHEKGIDLELHIMRPYHCELWFKDHRAPDVPPVSMDLTDDYSALRKPFDLLTSR
jgi:hypothetical protein